MKTNKSTIKSAERLESAKLILYHNPNGFGITHIIYIPRGRCSEEEVAPTFAKPHFQCGRTVFRRAARGSRDCLLNFKKATVGVVYGETESFVQFARIRAVLDLWIGRIGYMMALDSAENRGICVPVTGCWCLLTCRDWLDQVGLKDFEVWTGRSQETFILVSRSEDICVIIFPALHAYVHYPVDEKKKLTELLSVEKVAVSAFSIFVAHVYVQHGCSDCWCSHSLPYPSHDILSGSNLKDGISCAYGLGFCCNRKVGHRRM